jgi:hypothetical protein
VPRSQVRRVVSCPLLLVHGGLRFESGRSRHNTAAPCATSITLSRPMPTGDMEPAIKPAMIRNETCGADCRGRGLTLAKKFCAGQIQPVLLPDSLKGQGCRSKLHPMTQRRRFGRCHKDPQFIPCRGDHAASISGPFGSLVDFRSVLCRATLLLCRAAPPLGRAAALLAFRRASRSRESMTRSSFSSSN